MWRLSLCIPILMYSEGNRYDIASIGTAVTIDAANLKLMQWYSQPTTSRYGLFERSAVRATTLLLCERYVQHGMQHTSRHATETLLQAGCGYQQDTTGFELENDNKSK